jgi:glycosyltransferase involved in cell wall biosynthesis
LPNNAFIITYVANFALNKGHGYLLEAFERIVSRYPQAYLVLVGEERKKKL